jgi:ketosteroid isomerase-like protein
MRTTMSSPRTASCCPAGGLRSEAAPLALRAFAFAAEGAVGYIIGGFARQKDEPDIGKFTLTLRKSADGRWLIMSDLDNGNTRR